MPKHTPIPEKLKNFDFRDKTKANLKGVVVCGKNFVSHEFWDIETQG